MKRILIVEDDLALSEGVALALRDEGTEIMQADTLAKAGDLLRENSFDLAIMDINLPDGSGLDLMRQVKERSGLPVILLTANDMETDIVAGLELGADDYITKPFSLAVLRARVKNQLRRGGESAGGSAPNVIKIDDFSFDFAGMEFAKAGEPIDLSKTEQKLLRLLVENRGRTLPRAALVDKIWTDGAEYVDENALSVTVKRLRNKLEDNPSKPRYIKTVYAIGYTWVTD